MPTAWAAALLEQGSPALRSQPVAPVILFTYEGPVGVVSSTAYRPAARCLQRSLGLCEKAPSIPGQGCVSLASFCCTDAAESQQLVLADHPFRGCAPARRLTRCSLFDPPKVARRNAAGTASFPALQVQQHKRQRKRPVRHQKTRRPPDQ
jgi:hypothetical protein